MDRQARFRSCGPPLVLRMLKQGRWLFLWSLVPLTISGAVSNSQGPPKPYITSLSEDRRQVLKERLRGDILENRFDGAFTLKAKTWAVRGTVP